MAQQPKTFGETVNAAIAARRQRGIDRVVGTQTEAADNPAQAMLDRLFPNHTTNDQGDTTNGNQD